MINSLRQFVSKQTRDVTPKVQFQVPAEPAEPPRIRQSSATLRDYKLLEKIGEGAFSLVHRAVHIPTGRAVAVKIIDKTQLSSSQLASTLKEVAIMRRIDHPNVVALLDFKQTADKFYIIMEYVDGGELFHQIVKLTYFSEDLARHVILQVASAIRYLHDEVGVVHRDIKPENLLFYPIEMIPSKRSTLFKNRRKSDDPGKMDEGEFTPGVGGGGVGVIKLADFGLSKVMWDQNTKTPCGTVGYTAPEIVRDEKYSKSVDMWSLGCVLYTVLCGFPPFYDEDVEVLTSKVSKGQFSFLSPWWDEISVSAKDLVARLLTVDPNKRLTIHEFLEHPWCRGERFRVMTARQTRPAPSRVAEEVKVAEKGEIVAENERSVGLEAHGMQETNKGAEKLAEDAFQHDSTTDNRYTDYQAVLEEEMASDEKYNPDDTEYFNEMKPVPLTGPETGTYGLPSPSLLVMKQAINLTNDVNRKEVEKELNQANLRKKSVLSSKLRSGTAPSPLKSSTTAEGNFSLDMGSSSLLERRKKKPTGQPADSNGAVESTFSHLSLTGYPTISGVTSPGVLATGNVLGSLNTLMEDVVEAGNGGVTVGNGVAVAPPPASYFGCDNPAGSLSSKSPILERQLTSTPTTPAYLDVS